MGRMDNYVEVKDRIVQFYERYPEGSLRCKECRVVEVDGVVPRDKHGNIIDGREPERRLYFLYIAQAFRTPDDQAPAEGIAWEPIPGHTAYTHWSEAMNAETSAWGRAIVALGISADKGIASANEVRQAEERRKAPDPQQVAELKRSSKRKTLAAVLSKTFNGENAAVSAFIKEQTGKDSSKDLTLEEMDALIEEVAA